MGANDKIFVTQPSLPPMEEFISYVQQIWDSKILTNGGPLHQQLENELCKFLGVKYISLFNNGTIALMTALQAMELKGEVITTPYSFVATTNSLIWNNLKPVFVDIDPKTFNIDTKEIEKHITAATTAILLVHCYGHNCEVEKIQEIADKHKLKVIYDAAHAFGVSKNGNSILNFGDLSILSFHATKVFNTFEGGAIVCSTPEMKARIDSLKNFGFINNTTDVSAIGLNGKMSEINAALGLTQLKYVYKYINERREKDQLYRAGLKNITGITVPSLSLDFTSNYSYFPVLVEDSYGISRDELFERMAAKGIIARKYFYPLITDFTAYVANYGKLQGLKNSSHVAERVICLPIYPQLSVEKVSYIVELIRSRGDV